MPTAPGVVEVVILALAIGVVAWAARARIIGPGSMAGLGRTDGDLAGYPAFMWLTAAVGTLLFAGLATALAREALGKPGTEASIREEALPVAVGYGAACLWCLAFAWILSRRWTVRPAWLVMVDPTTNGTWGAMVKGVAWFIGLTPVVLGAGILAAWVHGVATGAAPDPVAHETLRVMLEHKGSPWTWALIFGAVVGAPVVEEHLYRAFLQTGMRRAGLGPAWAIAVTTGVFVLMHVGAAPLHALVPLAVLSVGLGVAYERTGRLLAPVVVHGLFNAGNIALAMAR